MSCNILLVSPAFTLYRQEKDRLNKAPTRKEQKEIL
jgi:hypothetical protein